MKRVLPLILVIVIFLAGVGMPRCPLISSVKDKKQHLLWQNRDTIGGLFDCSLYYSSENV